jgi:hypothetical protein
MSKTMLAAVGSLCLAIPGLAQAPAAVPAPQTPRAASSKVWIGRYGEVEDFLKTAPIVRMQDIGVGVTHARRAFFAAGGPAASAIVKNLPPGNHRGFWDSYKSEIAAYELDKLLALDMVPPTVERRVEHDLVSVQLWVEDCRPQANLDRSQPPDPAAWNHQVRRQRVFENLIANIDENPGNILVDPLWNMILIDHSRCFFSDAMPFEKQMTRIDRPLFDKLKTLDEASVTARLKPWVMSGGKLRDILKRRDRIVVRFEKLIAERGESVVIEPY